MSQLLFELVIRSAERMPDQLSLSDRADSLSYASLARSIEAIARATVQLGLERGERAAVYLPNRSETVIAMFGAVCAGCVFVPINPLLRPAQVGHILRDCAVRLLVTSSERAVALSPVLQTCLELRQIVLVGDLPAPAISPSITLHRWGDILDATDANRTHRVIDTDIASIFYTSGSTGRPKGVVASHRNLVAGAQSVAEYLANVSSDRLLGILPLSFDYGFSQLSTAFHVGASVALMDYLLPRDVILEVVRQRTTGLAGVPPLWNQLANLEWPEAARRSLRYITNSGGAMPLATLGKLRAALPDTQPFLMYGLTEAFRSTYLPPAELDRRPGSIGKAIPNAEIFVVRPDGTACETNEPGELVHRGALVTLGYWNDAEKTAERYKPVPMRRASLILEEIAVWSGDTVRMDEEGFLYFVARRDEMIKTSGYRVSPTEVEEVVFTTGLVADAAAIGVSHPTLGQAIVLVAVAAPGTIPSSARLLDVCRQQLPNFMVPQQVEWRESLPRNPNGKYDRSRLAVELTAICASSEIVA